MFFSRNRATGSVDFIIVGLGNPGSKYDKTRHNAGFIVIDKIAAKTGVTINKMKFKGLTATATIGGSKVLLLKPSTFMNLSGQSVLDAMNFYKCKPENVLIIFDDISLEPGKMRIRRNGSDGGHNGMKNIIYLSGMNSFPRIKIGVGKKPHPDYELANWVLSRFSDTELKLINAMADNSVTATELIIKGSIDDAMSKFNS